MLVVCWAITFLLPVARRSRPSRIGPLIAKMSVFERYLTLWVALCIVVGIALGHCFPASSTRIGAAELAQVNLPVAVLIWLMIIPMLLKIDFAALGKVRRALARHRRHAVHQLGGQAVLDGAARLAVHRLAVPALAARRPDRQLHRRPDPAGRRALHRHGLRVEQPVGRRAALHPDARWRSTTRSWWSPSRRSSACCSACRRSPCRGRRCCSRSCSTSSCRSSLAQILRRSVLSRGGAAGA